MPTTQHYFTNCLTLDALTKERNRLARIHHPDVGGKVEVMQDINAQYEAAKKRLSAPTPQRVYCAPGPGTSRPMPDFIEQMYRWAADVENQRKTQERNAYRDQVARQKERLTYELNWALEECRKATGQGLLRGCQLYTDRMQSTLYVGGNTYPYRQWFKDHGFRWNPDKKQWHFYKKPLSKPDEEDDDDYDDED